MKIYFSLSEYEQGELAVATIGTFDGLHPGHKKILQRLKDIAAEIGGETVLISFHPHPRLVLFPEKHDLQLLQTLEEKIQMLSDFGIDKLLLIPFTKEFAATPSELFIEQVLAKTVGVSRLVIGYDHHFGKNRAGDIHELRELSPRLGYEVEEIPAQVIDHANVSSTKIRQALLAGNIEQATHFLGYSYKITGTVIHGEKQGRLLGYPTANIKPNDSTKLIPANGIYCVAVYWKDQKYYGMMSVGLKPTMGIFERGIEVNIFDFSTEIYGETLTVEYLAYIRGEKKFDSLTELIQAIDGDKAFCLEYLKNIS